MFYSLKTPESPLITSSRNFRVFMTHYSLKIDASIELKVLKISWITEELKKLSKKSKKGFEKFSKNRTIENERKNTRLLKNYSQI